MREMPFTKLKFISRRLCKALGISLCCTFTKLDCCILQRLERESKFSFSKKYFIFLKWFLNSSEGILPGQLTGRRGEVERKIHQSKFSLHHCYKRKNVRRKNVTEFLVVSDCYFYYFCHTIIQLLVIVFTSINQQINQLITRWKKNYLN